MAKQDQQMSRHQFLQQAIISKIVIPLLSRFFIVELVPYTYEQFCEISNELLSGHKVEVEVASVIANAVWNES